MKREEGERGWTASSETGPGSVREENFYNNNKT